MADNDDKCPKCPKCGTTIYTYGRPGSYETAVAEHVVGGMECDLIRLEAADLRTAIEMIGHDWFEEGTRTMMRAPEQMTRDEVNVGLVAACERLDGLRRQLDAAEERLRLQILQHERVEDESAETIEDLTHQCDAEREAREKAQAACAAAIEPETECCGRCQGSGALYADGHAHYHSEGAPTVACPVCGGEGRVRIEVSLDGMRAAGQALLDRLAAAEAAKDQSDA